MKMQGKRSLKKASLKPKNGKPAPKKREAKQASGTADVTKSSNGNGKCGIKKQYMKTGNLCNVTFVLPKEAAPEASVITIVGDFNNWDLSGTPMKKLKTGDYKVTLKLPRGKEYRFRYLIDSNRWENDWCADGYVRNSFGGDDSLVKV